MKIFHNIYKNLIKEKEMENTILNEFTSEENQINNKLDQMFTTWFDFLKNESYFADNNISEDCFIQDGIFPKYSQQKIKILYLGKESYDLEGYNYIHKHYEWIKNCDSSSMNTMPLWRKTLKFTWGIENNKDWKAIPDVQEIADSFAKENGISFGMENVSKISRPYNNSARADWANIIAFVNKSLKSDINFFLREIDIINPDVIVSMNVIDKVGDLIFENELEYVKHMKSNAIYNLHAHNKMIPLIDTYHFSSTKIEQELYENLQVCITDVIR